MRSACLLAFLDLRNMHKAPLFDFFFMASKSLSDGVFEESYCAVILLLVLRAAFAFFFRLSAALRSPRVG